MMAPLLGTVNVDGDNVIVYLQSVLCSKHGDVVLMTSLMTSVLTLSLRHTAVSASILRCTCCCHPSICIVRVLFHNASPCGCQCGSVRSGSS